MKSIGYWQSQDAPSSQNLFVYILEHPSRQEVVKNWAASWIQPAFQRSAERSEGGTKT
jgi:hypothetical protein